MSIHEQSKVDQINLKKKKGFIMMSHYMLLYAL